MRQWRLIYDKPTSGVRNMAVDAALLHSGTPTLRLYGWSPACLSLGYGQRSSEVDMAAVERYGWQVVRRPTGGRAILHADEVTYSLTLPIDDPIAQGGIIDSYRRISAGLMAGLATMGLMADPPQEAESAYGSGAICFETPAHYEIAVRGRKLIGSAQVRRKHALLQHGSLPLHGDMGRICDVLHYVDEAQRAAARIHVRQRATHLCDALNTDTVSWEVAAAALVQGIAATFQVCLNIAELTPAEEALAQTLMTDVYGSAEWTYRR